MSQTSCERCGFPIPMRWLHAGGDLSQPNHSYQCTDRTLMRSGTSQNASCIRPTSRMCRYAAGVVLASRP